MLYTVTIAVTAKIQSDSPVDAAEELGRRLLASGLEWYNLGNTSVKDDKEVTTTFSS